jgi:lipopolysaccharide export system permease protein
MAVGLFLFVMITGSLIREVFPGLARGAIDWSQFFEILAYTVPSMLPYSLPMGVLAGVLIVLGRMSAQNEILAMKAAGMSLWRITSPIFCVALIATILSIFINLEIAPGAVDSVKRIFAESASVDPARFIAPGEFNRRDRDNLTIYAEDRQGDLLIHPWIWEMNENKQAVRVIRADSATISYDSRSGMLKLVVKNAGIVELDRHKPEDFTETARFHFAEHLPVEFTPTVFNDADRKRKLRHLTIGELLKVRESGGQLSAEDKENPEKRFAARIATQTQIQSNIANAFGILSMTMLAIPLGIKASRSETLVNVAIALFLALSFYVLTICVTWIQNAHFRPDILIWLPNILYQSIGGCLLWRAARQ